MAGDRVCCTLRQMESGSFPSERLEAVFYFFPLFFFFITAWLTASAFYQTSIVYLCSVQSHLRWQAIRGEPLPFHSLLLLFLSFILSVSFLPFALSFCKPFSSSNKWVLNWHSARLSPMEIHRFIIKSGKAHRELRGTIMWQDDIFPWHSQLILACFSNKIKNYLEWLMGMRCIRMWLVTFGYRLNKACADIVTCWILLWNQNQCRLFTSDIYMHMHLCLDMI